jgi:tRNA nucleotidyltransferase (CCA-adding enzyme)
VPEDVLAFLRSQPGVGAVLDALGGRADTWIVGGAVRDALLGRPARELDLVTTADPVALAAELGAQGEEHERFGTAQARAAGLDVEVARARTETYAEPGALPDVTWAGLEEDLARRDFSVNTLAVGLDGALHGVPGARADLEAGVLRVLHDRSFLDDPTRLWRAARLAARLGFGLDPDTERLAREAVAGGALRTVSGPRLGNELRLALDEPDPAAALTAAHELGLLPPRAHPRRALVRDALALLPEDGRPGVVVLAVMAAAVGPVFLQAWLDELGMPARERDAAVAAVGGAEPLAAQLLAATRPSAIAAAARRRGVEEVALAGALGADAPARRWLQELRHVRLEIGGEDLLAAGVPAGPEVGERLARALAAKLDGEAAGREQELAAALA